MNKLFIPKHIAIIMDGNSRWAKKNSVSDISGYREGIKVAQDIIKSAKKMGVQHLTLYAFSIENWNRPKDKVEKLMTIFKGYLKKDINELIRNDIKVQFIGNFSRLDPEIINLMQNAEDASHGNSFNLRIAISYGARDEILDAAIRFSTAISGNDSKEIMEQKFNQIINPDNIPDPDLLIRTSGEHRVSNFLLWQIAYTELYFVDKLWPEFTEEDLEHAIEDFNKRERRYGK
ncbi:MAG: undecaprenyl diphosphate synthase [Candidatus Midichloriaceae bacterium]|jgi:undecaprenyl diphosphate synthase